VKKLRKEAQRLWDVSPKELKVLLYVALAAALEAIAKELNVDLFKFVPEVYRVATYNLVVVFLVEMAKRLKEGKKK